MGATGSMVAKDFYSVTGNDAVEFNGQTFEGLQYQRQFEIFFVSFIGKMEKSMQVNYISSSLKKVTKKKGIGDSQKLKTLI